MKHTSNDYFYTFVPLFTVLIVSYLLTLKGCKLRECICLVHHHTRSALNTAWDLRSAQWIDLINESPVLKHPETLKEVMVWKGEAEGLLHPFLGVMQRLRPHIHNYYLAAPGSGWLPGWMTHGSRKGRLRCPTNTLLNLTMWKVDAGINAKVLYNSNQMTNMISSRCIPQTVTKHCPKLSFNSWIKANTRIKYTNSLLFRHSWWFFS